VISQASLSSHLTATSRIARRASRHAILLATSALVSLALPTMAAHALDQTWTGSQDGNFNNANNWGGNPPPNGTTDTATFNANADNNIQFTTATTLGALTLNPNAGTYSFDTNGKAIAFDGAISVGSGASLTLNYNGGNGITFEGAARRVRRKSMSSATMISISSTAAMPARHRSPPPPAMSTSILPVMPRTRRSKLMEAAFLSRLWATPVAANPRSI
jgi:hypothetical protein